MPLLCSAQKMTLGTTVTRDGGEYSGEMVVGKPQGKGKATYANGNWYEGEYDKGRRQGYGVYTFSDKIGCRTWWDLFHTVYGWDIDSEKDARVTTILTYNGLDASYVPQAGESVKLPPPDMFPSAAV